MKLASVLLGALFATQAAASSWLGNEIYNKWHETELERWLDDHDIPYPKPADRKEKETLVKDNWNRYVITPYYNWDFNQMTGYLKQKGVEVQEKNKENADWLNEQIKKKWYENEAKAEEGYGDAKTWVFDTWTDSQLKAFLDYNHIPAPQPKNRDSLLTTARSNYATIAEKAEETAQYPGNWLYKSWSDSDLKKWLDTNGYPAPQPYNRDKLIAAVRRNSRVAGQRWNEARDSVSDSMFNAWSESQLKEFLDKNGVKNIPQKGKKDELLALARENKAKLTGDTFSQSMTSYYGAATQTANSWLTQATQAAVDSYGTVADKALETWSDTRLKAYLDARGVAVPQNGKKDEIVALARRYKYLAATNQGYWSFENWTVDDLKAWMMARGEEVSDSASSTREELAASAAAAYQKATKTTGNSMSSVTSALAAATDYIRNGSFDSWTESELKKYLDTYGIKTYQGTTRNEMVAKARYWNNVMSKGWTQESAMSRFQRQLNGAYNQLMAQIGIVKADVDVKATQASASARKAAEKVKAEL